MKRTFTFLMVSLLAFVGVKAEVAADLVGKYFSVAEPATALQTDTWYLLRNQGRNAYISEEADAVKMKSTSAVAAVADADANAGILFKFAAGANEGQYSIVSGNGNYLTFGSSSSAVSASAVDYIIGSIAEGYWYMQDPTSNIVADGNAAGGTFVGWGTSVPTGTNGNNAYQFLEVALFDEAVMTTLSKAAGMAYDLQVASGLVTDASKFSSNAKEPSEGTFGALIDGEYTSFFHSAYSVSVDGAHYLQAEVNEPVKDFFFYFKKRSHNNNNRPTDITVLGSNDGQEFKEITTINTGFPTDAADLDYTSAVINASEAYKYFRFVVNKTNSSTVFFTFSEFYLLPADKVEALAAAQALVAAGPAAENYDELAAAFEAVCAQIQAEKIAKLHGEAVANAEAILASAVYNDAPALGQYLTASYDTFKAAVEELKAEATQENVDAIKAALVAFEATKNLPLFTIDSQKDYAAGQSIYENENGGLNFKTTDTADKSMLWAFDINATEVGLTDKVVVRNAATGNLFWGASFISVIETEPAVEGDGVFMFKTEGTGSPVHAQKDGSAIVRWSSADANTVGGASTWKFTFVGVSNPAAYDLSEVAASFKEQAMAFAGLQENAALSALSAVQEKWAEGMGVVEPLLTAVEAGELVLKADVEAAMEMMSGIQAVVAYYAGTYSEKLAEAEEFLATLEEGSDRYVAWDAAIVEYKNVSAVTAVKELEDKVAALAEAFANLPEDEPAEPEVPELIVWTINQADYPGGEQYAKDEPHVINEELTIYTTDCHWRTDQLRVYSSSSNNGFFYSNKLPAAIKSIEFTAGYKKDALVVYGSNDGAEWTKVTEVAVPSTSYTSGLVADFTGTAYNYFKVDVKGTNQLRITQMIITLDPAVKLPGGVVSAPTFSLSGCNLFAPATVELTAAEGTIYWSTDNETFVPYTEAIAIEASCTVYAYAELDGTKSTVATAEYVMAATYDNVAALLAAEATSTGVPVIVKLEAVVDSFGLNKDNEIVSVFLIEGTDTLMVYDYNIPADYVKGNVVKGQLAGLWKDYYGTLELCNVDYSGATVTDLAYDLSEVKDAFEAQAMEFVGLQGMPGLSSLPAVSEKWAEVMGVVEPLRGSIAAGEKVLKADVVAAMAEMTAVQEVVAYYPTYSEVYYGACDLCETLDPASEDYAALDAVINQVFNVSQVTTVAELEAKAAALNAAVESLYDLSVVIEGEWEDVTNKPNEYGWIIIDHAELLGLGGYWVPTNNTNYDAERGVMEFVAGENTAASLIQEYCPFGKATYRLTGKAFHKGATNAVLFVGDQTVEIPAAAEGASFENAEEYFTTFSIEFTCEAAWGTQLNVGYSCEFDNAEDFLVVGGLKLEEKKSMPLNDKFSVVAQNFGMFMWSVSELSALYAAHEADLNAINEEAVAINEALYNGEKVLRSVVMASIVAMEAEMAADYAAVINYYSGEFSTVLQEANQMMWSVEGTEAYDVLAAAIPSEEAISAVKELAELQAMVAALKAAMETASEYIPTEVVLNKTVIEIKVGETFQLEATVLPAKASQAIEWYSSDWKGNTITVENGLVTALAEGEVTVTACSVADWNLYAECVIKVVAAPVEDGIDNVEAETETVIYDLSGRRVTEMKKGGIYIVNGKKVIK